MATERSRLSLGGGGTVGEGRLPRTVRPTLRKARANFDVMVASTRAFKGMSPRSHTHPTHPPKTRPSLRPGSPYLAPVPALLTKLAAARATGRPVETKTSSECRQQHGYTQNGNAYPSSIGTKNPYPKRLPAKRGLKRRDSKSEEKEIPSAETGPQSFARAFGNQSRPASAIGHGFWAAPCA